MGDLVGDSGKKDFSSSLRNGQMQKQRQRQNAGSLHDATDDETVRRFSRDDTLLKKQGDALLREQKKTHPCRRKKHLRLCNGKGVAVKLKRWQAFLLTRSASATAVRTAGAANSLLSIWIFFDPDRFFCGREF
jgi:hypothetical protein